MPNPLMGGMGVDSSASLPVDPSRLPQNDEEGIGGIRAEGGRRRFFVLPKGHHRSRISSSRSSDDDGASSSRIMTVGKGLRAFVGRIRRKERGKVSSQIEHQPGASGSVGVSAEEIFRNLEMSRAKLRKVSRQVNLRAGGVEKSKLFMREGFKKGFSAGFKAGLDRGSNARLSPSLEEVGIKDIKKAIKKGSPQEAFHAAFQEGFKRGFNFGSDQNRRVASSS